MTSARGGPQAQWDKVLFAKSADLSSVPGNDLWMKRTQFQYLSLDLVPLLLLFLLSSSSTDYHVTHTQMYVNICKHRACCLIMQMSQTQWLAFLSPLHVASCDEFRAM